MTPLMERTGETREELHAGITAIYTAAKSMLDAGKRPHITLTEHVDDITAKQRAFLHAAVFPQIAEQVRVGDKGERFVAKVWKEHFRELFLGHHYEMVKMPGQKRPTPRKVRNSTEDLGVKAYSEHIDKVIAHAATELGVVFVFRADEREAVRYVAPKRKATPKAKQPIHEPEGAEA